MASISFMLRPSARAGSHHIGNLTLRIIHCRQVKVAALSDCRLYLHEWDKRAQTVIYPEDTPERHYYLKSVAKRLDSERAIIAEYIAMLEERGNYSAEEIIRLYRRRQSDSNLLGYSEYLAKDMERTGQERTAKAYRTVARGLVRFNSKDDIPLCQINTFLIKEFESHLRKHGKLPNTISYYMRNLRAIYNKAITARLISVDKTEKPFAGVYTGIAKTMKRALSLEELRKLHTLDFAPLLENKNIDPAESRKLEGLRSAWLLFFFCFHARGMCFIDLAYLRKENLRGGVIRYRRKKTGQHIEIKVTPEMHKIIDNFAPQVKTTPYLFPIITNSGKKARLQYENALNLQNRRLKKLAKMAIIHPVSTHVSRHTWATIGKQNNIPLRVLSECLGHSSEKTTLIYMGSLDSSILDRANELIALSVINPTTVKPRKQSAANLLI